MSVTRFAFKLQDGDNVIDLAQCMSIVQRTMIRQKQIFTVIGGQIIDNPTVQTPVKISTAPNFWYIRAGINRAFKAWKDQRAKTLANANLETGVGAKHVGKFADFKLSLMGENSPSLVLPHFTGSSTVLPIAPPDEYARASVTQENGAERHFRILGGHTSTFYGTTYGWLSTRVIPDSEYEPNMPDLDGNSTLDYKEDFLNLLNETDDDQAQRLELLYEDNDNAPFPVRDIYGGVSDSYNLQLQSFVYVNENNPSQMIPGFKALCGLVHVNVASSATEPILFLDVLNTPEGF
jgi:hypothetical protein